MAVPALTEAELWDIINREEAELAPALFRLWELVRIIPEKWQQHPRGDSTGGFWAVALIGRRVIWHNEIEDGFDISRFSAYGVIDDYGASQFTLSMCMHRLKDVLDSGYDIGPWSSGPHAGEYPGHKR